MKTDLATFLNEKEKDLRAARAKLTGKCNTTSRRLINGKLFVIDEIRTNCL